MRGIETIRRETSDGQTEKGRFEERDLRLEVGGLTRLQISECQTKEDRIEN